MPDRLRSKSLLFGCFIALTGCAGVQRAAIGPPVVEVVSAPTEASTPRITAPPSPLTNATRFALHPEGSRFQVRSGDLFGTYLSDFTKYHVSPRPLTGTRGGWLAVAPASPSRGRDRTG